MGVAGVSSSSHMQKLASIPNKLGDKIPAGTTMTERQHLRRRFHHAGQYVQWLDVWQLNRTHNTK